MIPFETTRLFTYGFATSRLPPPPRTGPRGIVSAGSEEPNALVEIGAGGRATPSVRATREPLVPGLVARVFTGEHVVPPVPR